MRNGSYAWLIRPPAPFGVGIDFTRLIVQFMVLGMTALSLCLMDSWGVFTSIFECLYRLRKALVVLGLLIINALFLIACMYVFILVASQFHHQPGQLGESIHQDSQERPVAESPSADMPNENDITSASRRPDVFDKAFAEMNQDKANKGSP